MNFIKFAALLWLLVGFAMQSHAQVPSNYFSWDNASVYFVITDRFVNGNTTNDHSYGRGFDGNGNPYTFSPTGSWHGGDLAGLTQKVNDGYFDSLGINAIWITAPYEQIHGWVAGSNGEFQHYAYHGYYALDWSEMDANMGTAAELQTFMDAAHSRKIRVIFDIVMNHTGYNTAHDMEEFNFGCITNAWKGWRPGAGQDWSGIHNFIDYTTNCTNGWGNWWGANWVRSGLPGYTNGSGTVTGSLAGLPDVITESTVATTLPPILINKWNSAKEAQEISELNNFLNANNLPLTPRNCLIKWLTDWVRKYGVDGFRVDTYKHVEAATWAALAQHSKLALAQWKAANPNKKIDDSPFWLVAEDFGHGPGKNNAMIANGFDAAINFNFQGVAATPTNLESTYANYANILNPDTTWNILSYISSHDTNLFDRNDLIDGGTSLLLCPGAIQIFYGDETARPDGPATADAQQSTRSPMNWSNINTDVFNHWKKLGQFRKKHPAIGAGSHNRIATSPYTFSRSFSKGFIQDNVVCVIGANGSTVVNVGSIFPNGTLLRDFYTNNTAIVTNGTVTFNANSNGVILIEDPNPVPRPLVAIAPASTYSATPLTITLTANDPNNLTTTLYYTTDATVSSSNLANWTVYTAPFALTNSAKVRAIAKNSNNILSPEISVQYYIGAIPDFDVYFKKPTTWASNTISCYYWNTNSPSNTMPTVAWPGTTMTSCANGWFKFTFKGTLATNLIFNGGNSTMQTADLSRSMEGWFDSGWSDSAPATFSGCSSSGGGNTGGGGTSTTSDSLDLYFYNAANWNNPTMYFWNNTPNPNNLTTTFPGIRMNAVPNKPKWFKASIAGATSTNLIFSNNSASQTANLFRNKDGWYAGNNCWTDTDPSDNQITLELQATSWTTPYIYLWETNPSTWMPWPGVPMTRIGNSNVYTYTIPNRHYVNFIFSNNGSNQSNDLSSCGESRRYVQGNYSTYNTLHPKTSAKLYLETFDNQTNTMPVFLKENPNFPLTDPYSSAPLNVKFKHINNSTTATINSTLLSVIGSNAIVDWVFLELRRSTSGGTTPLYTRAALLQADGDIVSPDGSSALEWSGVPQGEYFLTIFHRNHLGIRTLNKVTINHETPSLNFTNNSIALYGGSPLKSLGNVRLMIGGDANMDGSIDSFDAVLWESQNGSFNDYFLNSDYNADGAADSFDAVLWEINNGLFQEID
jgi:alpha-amylase